MADLNLTETFDFAPSIGECVLNGLSRIQIRGPMVKTAMLQMAVQEANLMQVEWSNLQGPNLWVVDAQEVWTRPGYATYAVDPTTIAVLEVTLGWGEGGPIEGLQEHGPQETDLLLTSISRGQYMAYPNKQMPGRPTVYWYDILIEPTITLWPVPDTAYRLRFTRFRRQMDASMRNAANFEAPYRFLDAACAGLAARLAVHYAPALEKARQAQYERAIQLAMKRDTENAPVFISPMIEFYSA
jgi:hypothetical protein